MPYVVAITRAPTTLVDGGYRDRGAAVAAPTETWLPAVAAALSMTAYDLRLRVSGPVPWVVARVSGGEEAARLVTRLRGDGSTERGFGAVSMDASAPAAFDNSLVSRAFAQDQGLRLEPGPRVIAYDAVDLVVHALLDEELGREVTRFSQRTHEPITSHSREREKRQALYVSPRGAGVVRLVEGTLGFPEESATTSRGRFESFVASVRRRIGLTPFRDAFIGEPRKRTSMRALSQSDTHRSTVQGNVAETDLAVLLLAKAIAEGQA